MVYKHQYFILDTKSKKVFDENRKELRLTGNAYRMLVFLCETKNANLTDIGTYLDFAKDYSEDHIRQYRYKINTIIGHNIIEYKNGIYSFIGEVKETNDLEKTERNTDLLQAQNVKLENIMEKSKNMKFTVIPAIAAIILLLLSFLDLPYGYYTFLRVAVTGVAIYYAYYLYITTKWQSFWFWALVAVGVLFNPISPIYLGDKTVWGVVDVITAIFFISLIVKFRPRE